MITVFLAVIAFLLLAVAATTKRPALLILLAVCCVALGYRAVYAAAAVAQDRVSTSLQF